MDTFKSLALGAHLNEAWQTSLKSEAGKYADDPALNLTLIEHSQAIDGWRSLDAVRQSRNPKDTPAVHLDKIAKATDTLVRNIASKANAASERLNKRIKEVDHETDQRLNLRPSQDATEIRAALARMDDKQRDKVIRQAVENADGELLHAVFTGRSITTGVPDDKKLSYRQQAVERHASDLLQLRETLTKAEKLMFKSVDDSMKLANDAIGSPELQAKFTREAQAADDALMQFNKSVGNA